MPVKPKALFGWPGGKGKGATIIQRHFPRPGSYQVYCEPFCGALNVLLSLPPARIECVNDLNKNLVNFWRMLLTRPREVERLCQLLPYSRALYDEYRASVQSGSFQQLDPVERAVRWFYVQRSGIAGKGVAGWGYRNHFQDGIPSAAYSYHEAVRLFQVVAARLQDVQIECQDFESILRLYDAPNAFFYVDPPYRGREEYYHDIPAFTDDDHRRLAACLNLMRGAIALSYYPDPLIDELYPADRWYTVSWQGYKNMEKTTENRQVAEEILLLNYQPDAGSLWSL